MREGGERRQRVSNIDFPPFDWRFVHESTQGQQYNAFLSLRSSRPGPEGGRQRRNVEFGLICTPPQKPLTQYVISSAEKKRFMNDMIDPTIKSDDDI